MITLDNGGTPLQSQGKETSKTNSAMPIAPASPQPYLIPVHFGNYISTTNNCSLSMNSGGAKISHLPGEAGNSEKEDSLGDYEVMESVPLKHK